MSTTDDPESTTGARPVVAPARDGRGRWRPGTTGNRGGRRRSLVATIRRATQDGAALVDALLAVVASAAATDRDKIAACRTLLDYGFSKPPVEIDTGDDERIPAAVIQRIIASVEGVHAG